MASTSGPSHILLLGSTGRTGRLFLAEALSHTHTVTALVRNSASLDDLIKQLPDTQRQSLNVVSGAPTSEPDLLSALTSSLDKAGPRNPVVVVSTLGQTRASGNPWAATTSPPMFMTAAISALLSAIKSLPSASQARVQKLVVMSMFGAGNSFDNLHCMIKPVMRHSNMTFTVEDHDGVNGVLRGQKEVKWVMVRPSMLKEGERRDVQIRDDDGSGERWLPSSVTTGSVADFLLGCVEREEWDGKAPVITN